MSNLTKENEINGHEYVDLGLSVMWATCNVGASSPEEYGDYFAWGETETKESYDKDNSKTYRKSEYSDIAGDPSLDAARAHWGSTWRLPSKDEMEELIRDCTWKRATRGGKKGFKITSELNGNSIFLPVAGYRCGASLKDAGEDGCYWTSTRYFQGEHSAKALHVHGRYRGDGCGTEGRDTGCSVRPVSECLQKKAPTPIITPTISGTINGHEYVDLGLSVKWATCNVGASSPEEYGDYFAWGETETKESYDKDNSKTYGKSEYGDIAGDPSLDAARAHWGSTWRLPTEDEAEELVEKCKWKRLVRGGKAIYKVTSRTNGNSIFLPAAGCRGALYDRAGEDGYYWTSAPPNEFGSVSGFSMNWLEHSIFQTDARERGYSVRPVSE